MQRPTLTATAGRFQTRGEDAIQVVDDSGKHVWWVSSDGTHMCRDCITAEGTSLTGLQAQIDGIQFSGLPSVIDAGTF